jgi:hypothetical protein
MAAMLDAPQFSPRRNVSAPRYRKGSVIVDIGIETLRHRLPEDLEEPIVVKVAEVGRFEIGWTIDADNLGEPVHGTLTIQVEPAPVREKRIITQLEDLPHLSGDE